MQPYVVARRSLRAPLVALTMGAALALVMTATPRWAAAQDATPSPSPHPQ